jgi:hypothetical protein
LHGSDRWFNWKTVIASQRVGAKRRPMTSSAKQSSFAAAKKESWIASSQVLLAMTPRRNSAFSRRENARAMQKTLSLR